MPRRRNSTSGRRLALWLLGGVVLLAGALYLLDPSLGGRFGEAPTARPQQEREKPRTQQRQPARAQAEALRSHQAGEARAPSSFGTSPEAPAIDEHDPETAPRPRVALVVDDLGRSVAEVESLAALGIPLSYAVLPYETETPQVVAALTERGAEILCHLPMEPAREADPGWGAVREGMTAEEITAATREALAAVPGAVGLNNHMGSRLTAERPAMEAVLAVAKEDELFFLDSRTTPESVAYTLARERGLPAAERHVFLDEDPDPEAIRSAWVVLLDRAESRGAAIAIAHPHPGTLDLLGQLIGEAQRRGIEFVPVSYLLDRSEDLVE